MRRAILCLVTDRRRLASRIGCPVEASADWLITQLRVAAHAGIDLVQIREGDLSAAALARLTRRAIEVVGGTSARVLVNDRVDVALATDAHGVHLKSSSVAPADVRAIAPRDWMLGLSVHDAQRASTAASRVDYLIAGAVRATASKPAGWPTLGFDGLARIVEAAGAVSVVGIGGLGPRDAGALCRAGARGLAGIDAFLPSSELGRFEESVHEAVSRLRFAFDSPEGLT